MVPGTVSTTGKEECIMACVASSFYDADRLSSTAWQF